MRTSFWAAGRRGAAVVVFLCAAMPAWSAAASAQQQLSEQAVRTFMDYAWRMTPQKFTQPDGKSVLIDKTKRDEVVVPVDNARDIIMAGRLTAHAQICGLQSDQVKNYQSLMRREQALAKWTDQQLIYINQLHLTTVMLLTGQINLVERQDGEKDVVVYKGKKPVKTCTDEQKTRVQKLVDEYLATEPNAPPAEKKKS